MIIDNLENIGTYKSIAADMALAIDFLRNGNVTALPTGRHSIAGESVFANIDRYDTRPAAQGKWEAHKRYLDIQYLVSGSEQIGWATIDSLQLTEPYDADRDVAFYAGSGDNFTLAAGMFAIFLPHDAHMPGIAVDKPAAVHKIVVKVQISDMIE